MRAQGPLYGYTNVCSTRGADLELAMVNFCCKKKWAPHADYQNLKRAGP